MIAFMTFVYMVGIVDWDPIVPHPSHKYTPDHDIRYY